MSALTIDQIKEKRQALEAHIEKAMRHFETITGCEIDEITFDRERSHGSPSQVVMTRAILYVGRP